MSENLYQLRPGIYSLSLPAAVMKEKDVKVEVGEGFQMRTDNKTEKALHAWRDALDRWYQEKLSDLQELAAFRTYGARQSKTCLEFEPARPTPATNYTKLEEAYNSCVQGDEKPKAGWVNGEFFSARVPHVPGVFDGLSFEGKKIEPSPLMQECLDYAEEKAREYLGRKIYHAPVATASQAAADRIREYLRSKTQGAGVTGLLGSDEGVGGGVEEQQPGPRHPKGASSFSFPEKKPKILCPRCGDRPWPTARPFDETDLNCPNCGSRELERVD